MIVKVQVSIMTTEDRPQVLIYNKSRSVQYQGEASKEIVKAMEGELKAYFRAHLEGTLIMLDRKERKWPSW